jgi:2-oxoglutarate ferredoxin oxidoreductase subunit gamma
MHHELIIAGFGGQGVLLAGQILVWAANLDDHPVVWSPSYGPEMRGGASHCTVIISSEPIGTPLVAHPDTEVLMNEPSLEKFLPALKPGGLLILNSSIIHSQIERSDIRRVDIPANQIAEDIGDVRSANVVMLGALLGLEPLAREESIQAALKERWGRSPKLLELNKHALQVGIEAGRKAKTV